MLFVVVVGFRRGSVVLLNVGLRSVGLRSVGLRSVGWRNRVLGWRWKHPPATNLLGIGSIRRALLEIRAIYSVWHLRASAQRTTGRVNPKLLSIWADRSLAPLQGQVWIYDLVILRLLKLEFDDSLFPSISQLRKDQARIFVGYNLDQP